MGTTVDSLEIQLQAQATKANTAIDTLITKLGTLNTSLTKINGSGLSGVANGVDKLSRSMQGLKNVGTADYTRLAKGIEKISNLDSGQISKAATAIVGFGKGLQSLNSVNVSKTSEQVANLAKGISQLGYKSSTKAIENIPLLASAMRKLMSELSKAPRVSQNLIDMTNALAKLSRTGASSGRAANALGNSLNTYTKHTQKASRGTKGLASALGKMYATYWLLFRFVGKIGESITLASDLVEVQNVVNTVFGDMSSKVEEYAQNSIKQFGMSELSFKQYASRFQAMGSAMGIDTSSIESANSFLNKATGGYVGLSDSMADVSLTLTQLTADMASFYNVSQKDVAEDLAAIFTGETRPLRQYGIDLTQATLQEWAMKNGLDANVKSMSQAEKTLLRYQYVLSNTTAAHGDFARTAGSWANQIRILQEQIKKFASIIGTGFIAAFKPFVQTLNKVMAKVIDFTQNVLNALGQIFGWEFEISGGGITDDLGDVSGDLADSAGSSGDLSDNLGQAAKNAKKLHSLGIDELNIVQPEDSSSGSGSGSGNGSGSAGLGNGGLSTTMKRNEAMIEAYKSSIKTLEELGDYIGDTLTNTMNRIDWKKVYSGAKNFGTGFANFLNGLISPALFGQVGKTIANSLNTAIYVALSFGETFDFYDFGVSIATGINRAFENFDFQSFATTINVWIDGIKETIKGFVDRISIDDILGGLVDFISGLEIDTIAIMIGGIAWKLGAIDLIKNGLITLLKKGVGNLVLNLTGVQLGKVTFSGVAKTIGGALKNAIGNASGSIVSMISGALGISGGAATAVFAGIVAAIIGVGLAIKDLWDTSESFRNSVSDMWEKIADAVVYAKTMIWDNTILPLWNKVKDLGRSIQDLWSVIYESYESSGLKQLFEKIVVFFGEKLTVKISSSIKIISNTFNIIGDIVGGLIDSLGGLVEFVKGVFTGNWDLAWSGVKKVVKGFTDAVIGFFDGLWENITIIFSPTIEFFREKYEKAVECIKNAFSPITTWFKDKWDNVKGVFKDVTSFFKTGFEKAYKAVTDVWDGIKSFFGKVANWIIDPIQKSVNGVIDGINWVFDKVGAKKPLKNWTDYPKFASGSNGLQSDTIGVVNDQAGSTYKELIVPPHGKPFIPEGRNVMLPMEKGTKIMPAGQTKALMDGMPKFKSGIGDFFGGMWEKVTNFTGDVLDYITHPSKIVQIAIDKFTDLSNIGRFFIPLATGAVNKLFDTVVNFVSKMFDNAGGAEKAVKWAIGIANDNSHGYDQANRWGNPDYDCSSLVITAFEKAGIKMKSAGATYTGNMYSAARSLGFADVTNGINLGNGKGLKRGDILLNRKNHTAMYVGNGKVVQASSNEKGGIRGGKPGDQTGKEINVSSYQNYPWNDVLRFVKKYKDGIGRISISDLLPKYSVGGFPEDGLFMANRGELVGQFSNGQTAVANNYQIVGGIKEGVKEAVSEILAPYLSDIAQNTRETADKDLTVRIQDRDIVTSYDRGKRRNGYSFT